MVVAVAKKAAAAAWRTTLRCCCCPRRTGAARCAPPRRSSPALPATARCGAAGAVAVAALHHRRRLRQFPPRTNRTQLPPLLIAGATAPVLCSAQTAVEGAAAGGTPAEAVVSSKGLFRRRNASSLLSLQYSAPAEGAPQRPAPATAPAAAVWTSYAPREPHARRLRSAAAPPRQNAGGSRATGGRFSSAGCSSSGADDRAGANKARCGSRSAELAERRAAASSASAVLGSLPLQLLPLLAVSSCRWDCFCRGCVAPAPPRRRRCCGKRVQPRPPPPAPLPMAPAETTPSCRPVVIILAQCCDSGLILLRAENLELRNTSKLLNHTDSRLWSCSR